MTENFAPQCEADNGRGLRCERAAGHDGPHEVYDQTVTWNNTLPRKQVWLGFNEAGMAFVWDDPSTCTKGDGTPMDPHEWMLVPVEYMRAAFAAMKTARATLDLP